VIVIDSDPETLNLGLTTGLFCRRCRRQKIFNGLVWLDGTYQPQPQLAESWTISPDGLIYTFKLAEPA